MGTEIFHEFHWIHFGEDLDTGEPERYFFFDKHTGESQGDCGTKKVIEENHF